MKASESKVCVCGARLEPGVLYCPSCYAEVPLVVGGGR